MVIARNTGNNLRADGARKGPIHFVVAGMRNIAGGQLDDR